LRQKAENGDDDNEDESKVVPLDTKKKASAVNASSRQEKSATSNHEIIGASVTTVFDSSRSEAPQEYSGGATHYNEIDTSADRLHMLMLCTLMLV